MPIYKQWITAGNANAAIWKIEEQETYFQENTNLICVHKSPKKRTEYFASRFLLSQIASDFPLDDIVKDENGKPKVDSKTGDFSLSHSWPYIAAIIDEEEETGIDIQTWNEHIGGIKHKFLSAEEQLIFKDDIKLLTVAWAAKEAVYKWNGKPMVDLVKHMAIEDYNNNNALFHITIYFTHGVIPRMVFVEGIVEPEFVCAYVTGSQEWAIY